MVFSPTVASAPSRARQSFAQHCALPTASPARSLHSRLLPLYIDGDIARAHKCIRHQKWYVQVNSLPFLLIFTCASIHRWSIQQPLRILSSCFHLLSRTASATVFRAHSSRLHHKVSTKMRIQPTQLQTYLPPTRPATSFHALPQSFDAQ